MPRTILPEQHRLVKAVAAALRSRCRIAAGSRMIVAVSGGADSVALLRALAALAPKRGWDLQLAVAHVQHHLRAARHADADAKFVAALARKLALPFLRADLDPPRRSDRVNREAWARGERYKALALMADSFNASVIVTAHHADDQLETLLMRLLRGTSVRGLGAMAWRRRLGPANPDTFLIRPMLAVARADIIHFLKTLKQPWREDHTNTDLSRLRARLRRQVTPLLGPDAPARAVALADHLRQVRALLDDAVRLAADHVNVGPAGWTIDRAYTRGLRPIVFTGLLHRLLRGDGVPPDRLTRRALAPLIRAARDTTGGRRTFQYTRGIRIVVEREIVRGGK